MEKDNLKMVEGNYDDYKLVYGLKYSNSPQGEDVKNGVAKFYIIKNEDQYFNDFVIFLNEDNWITVDARDFKNIDYINFIFDNLKQLNYQYVTFMINSNMENDIIEFIKNSYSDISYETVEESGYEYIKFKKNL